jgi:hypothetical protein
VTAAWVTIPEPRAGGRRPVAMVRRPRLVARASSLAAASSVAACSVLLQTGPQCNVDADCRDRGLTDTVCVAQACVRPSIDAGPDVPAPVDAGDAGDPRWACLGSVPPKPVVKPQVLVTVPLIDVLTRKPVTTGVVARPCAKADVTCSAPLAAPVLPDSMGRVAFTLDAGFDGYVEVDPLLPDGSAPMDAGASDAGIDGGSADAGNPLAGVYLPAMVFFNPPLVDDTVYISIPLVSYGALTTLAAQFGNTINPMFGAPFALAADCDGKPADGVSVSIDVSHSSTRTFYFVNGLPTEFTDATDATGYSGFINVPPGIRTITGKRKATGERTGTISVVVRPGTTTYAVLPPN